jgi:hypothetical protein
MRTDHYRITVNKRGIDVVQDSGLGEGDPLTVAEYDALIFALSKWRDQYASRGDVERVSAESTNRLPEWGNPAPAPDTVTYTVMWRGRRDTGVDAEGIGRAEAADVVQHQNELWFPNINHWAIGSDGSIIGRVGARE